MDAAVTAAGFRDTADDGLRAGAVAGAGVGAGGEDDEGEEHEGAGAPADPEKNPSSDGSAYEQPSSRNSHGVAMAPHRLYAL